MIIPFKFFRGKVYTDEFTLPIARRMSGRTIAQDLSNQVQQIVRSPEYVPAGYVPYTERDMEYYHTEEFLFFDVSEERYDPIWSEPYKVMLYRSIEEGNTVEGQIIKPDHYMYNFPDVI